MRGFPYFFHSCTLPSFHPSTLRLFQWCLMTGKLYVLGVGPGDPELITLKAARILREIGCICVPKGREEGKSLALSIIRETIDLKGKEIVEAHFPMCKTARPGHAAELDAKWNETVEAVLDRLNRGSDVAFITIGDPTIYSTFFYLYDRLIESSPKVLIEIVPGVSSINASAARAHIPLGLGDGKIAILPANYLDDLKAALERFDTVVLMKVHKVLDEIKATLGTLGLVNSAVYVSRATMTDEFVCADLTSLQSSDLDYFSMVIVKK
jgi:precorrin-2/cobalt-factor-2 C20-methyltransferase